MGAAGELQPDWHSFSRRNVAGWLIGLALDHWLHTTWLYLAGLILGIVAGFVELIRTATASIRMQMMPNDHRRPDHRPAAEFFYSGALDRISRFMVVLAVLLSAAGWLRFGWRVALGFACGCAIAYLNFHWLKRVVTALADRATQTGSSNPAAEWCCASCCATF